MLWQTFRRFWVGTCYLLFCPAIGLAGVNVCQDPGEYSHVSLSVYSHNEAVIADAVGQSEREGYDLDLLFTMDDTWSFGAGHYYSNLGVELSGLPTNGHLHTTVLPVHRHSARGDKRRFRLSVAPTLSGSSNVMRQPGEYSSDTLQLLAALIWSRKLSDRLTFHYGLCGDHRFGGYAVYPSVGIDWRPRDEWRLELGFPETWLTYKATRSVSLSLGAAPDGNEWHVKNKNLDRESQLVYEATLVEGVLSWQVRDRVTISASFGRLLDNRYEVTLQDGSQVQLSSDAEARFAASLEWRFR